MVQRRRFQLDPRPVQGLHDPADGQPYALGWLRPADLGQVVRLERQAFPEPIAWPSLFRLWLRGDTRFLAVRKGKQVAAYIGFQVFGPIAHTISMGVHPDHRRRGLAAGIQAAADRVAAHMGARWFMGEVRKSNAAQLDLLLQRLGWQAIGVCGGFFGNGEDAVVVWHPLDSPAAQAVDGDAGTVVHAERPEEY